MNARKLPSLQCVTDPTTTSPSLKKDGKRFAAFDGELCGHR
jgi:hypothetical protein